MESGCVFTSFLIDAEPALYPGCFFARGSRYDCLKAFFFCLLLFFPLFHAVFRLSKKPLAATGKTWLLPVKWDKPNAGFLDMT